MTRPTSTCAVPGCGAPGVVRDNQRYTLYGLLDGEDPDGILTMDFWYCQAHVAVLFALIDRAVGNTRRAIVQDFRADGVL